MQPVSNRGRGLPLPPPADPTKVIYFGLFLFGLVSGLGIGHSWAATRDVLALTAAKREQECLIEEVKRAREQVARLIGGGK